MLAECGEPVDPKPIRLLGLVQPLSRTAVDALETLGATADLIWPADRSGRVARHFAARALCRISDPPAIAWLRTSADETARDTVEVHDLAAAADPADWERAARVVLRLSGHEDYARPLNEFPALVPLMITLAGQAVDAPDRDDLIDRLATEITSGRPACADWPAGMRADVLRQLRDPLPAGFRIQVVERTWAETRVLVDGRPVFAAAFDNGPAGESELRAETEAREVRLARAWCAEGCCGEQDHARESPAVTDQNPRRAEQLGHRWPERGWVCLRSRAGIGAGGRGFAEV